MALRRDDLDTADLARRYLAGESIRQLAKAYGTSYGTVHTRLDDAGIAFRGKGWRHPVSPPALPGR